MSWFIKKRQQKIALEKKTIKIPKGLWVKCEVCKNLIYNAELINTKKVCPHCNYHFRINVNERLSHLMDHDYKELFTNIQSQDRLNFTAVKSYINQLQKLYDSGYKQDAVTIVEGTIERHPVITAIMDWSFLAASMGCVVGEKIKLGAEYALKKQFPYIIVSCSGGARMQEGVFSLMQMAKISAALSKLDEFGIPYISILTDPTTGGVSASYAMLGDLNIAEPKAIIGFAGSRVIQQTIKQILPKEFQQSEFLLDHGMLDKIVPRQELKNTIAFCLKWMTYKGTKKHNDKSN